MHALAPALTVKGEGGQERGSWCVCIRYMLHLSKQNNMGASGYLLSFNSVGKCHLLVLILWELLGLGSAQSEYNQTEHRLLHASKYAVHQQSSHAYTSNKTVTADSAQVFYISEDMK